MRIRSPGTKGLLQLLSPRFKVCLELRFDAGEFGGVQPSDGS